MMIAIYSTFSTYEEAQTIARALLEKRLVACANIFQPHQAMYWWEGAVQHEQEVAAIFKTRPALFEAVRDHIAALHSYDTPCIVSYEIKDAHQPFLDWIVAETQQD